MMNLMKNMKIRSFLVFFVLSFILIPASVATFFAYTYTHSTIEASFSKDYVDSIFSEIENDITIILTQANALSLQLTTDGKFSNYVRDAELSYEERRILLEGIYQGYIPENSIIAFADFIMPSGERYRLGSDYTEYNLSQSYIENFTPTHYLMFDTCLQIDNKFYCPFGKHLYNYNKSYEIGDIVLYINQELLGSSYSDSNEDIFFISTKDKIISHPDEKYIGSVLYLPAELLSNLGSMSMENNGYVRFEKYVQLESLASRLTLTAIISNQVLFRTMNTIMRYILISFLGVGGIALISSVILSRNLIYRIANLQESMEVYTDNYQNFKPILPSNEIAALEASYNVMAGKIKDLIDQIEIEKEKQKNAELKTLQSQIAPHFLYNALGSISWKAKENKQYEIDDMLITLATFYRIGLHKGEDMITIADELRHVECYLEIEAVRFPELFEVTYDVDENLLACLIPKIILQPLVENVIKHGFKEMEQQFCAQKESQKRGYIQIRFVREGELIRFEVRDNGGGVEMKNGQLPESSSVDGGYGLHNVNERLQHYYGKEYGLQMESAMGKGTCVFGIIPLKE